MKPISIAVAALILLGLSVEVMVVKSSAAVVAQQATAQDHGGAHKADIVILPLPRQ